MRSEERFFFLFLKKQVRIVNAKQQVDEYAYIRISANRDS